jgi:hypothetical protein
MRNITRSPFPHLHLITVLEGLLRARNLPKTMNSTLAELSLLEVTPPSSPTPGAKGAYTQRKKTGRAVSLTQKESLPSKFWNIPPEPLYYFEDGLRKVPPYHYTYNTYCKERWRERTLLDIFVNEFRDRPEEYYVRGLSLSFIFHLYTNRKTVSEFFFSGKFSS